MKKCIKIIFAIICVIIFLLLIDIVCIFSINKPLLAKKEVNNNSLNAIYRGIFYDTYNCIEYSIPLIKPKGTKFNCATNIKTTSELNEVDGVSMTIKKGTLTKIGATVIIIDTNKNKYSYSSSFRIDEKKDGYWKEAQRIGDGSFNAMAYLVDKNNQLEMDQSWESIYGELPKGIYRLVKDVCSSEFCKETKEFSVVFEIE